MYRVSRVASLIASRISVRAARAPHFHTPDVRRIDLNQGPERDSVMRDVTMEDRIADGTTVPPAPTAPPQTLQQPYSGARIPRKVPSGACNAWARIFADRCEAISDALRRGHEPSVAEGIRRLLLLPEQVLGDTGGSSGRSRRIKAKIRDAELEDQLQEQPSTAHADAAGSAAGVSASQAVEDGATAARMRNHALHGNIGRAARCLDSLPVVPITAETLPSLHALHPPAPPPARARANPPATAPAQVEAEQFQDILKRLKAAAEGDFVIAFYNPVSVRRRTLLAEARDILLQHRPEDTPVMLASSLGRPEEYIRYRRLADLQVDEVDMLTVVLVGSSHSRLAQLGTGPRMYTPRGYARKIDGDLASGGSLIGHRK